MRGMTTIIQIYLLLSLGGPLIWWIAIEISRCRHRAKKDEPSKEE